MKIIRFTDDYARINTFDQLVVGQGDMLLGRNSGDDDWTPLTEVVEDEDQPHSADTQNRL